jgi:hypothetical protein
MVAYGELAAQPPGQISIWQTPFTRMACAHSVTPLEQISQMSGMGVLGQGFVIGGGPASSHTVLQSKYPLCVHMQLVVQVPSPVPQPEPGVQLEPW